MMTICAAAKIIFPPCRCIRNHFWSRALRAEYNICKGGDKFYQNDEATSEKPNSKPVNCKCPTLHISSSIYIYSYVQYEKTIQDEKLS